MAGVKVGSVDIQFGPGFDGVKANQLVQSLQQVVGAVNTLTNQVAALQAAGGGSVGKHELAGETGLGPVHTVAGLIAGQVLVATAATTAEFARLTFGELGGTDAGTFIAPVNGDVIAFVNGYWSAVPFSASLGLGNPGSDAVVMWDTAANAGLGGLVWALPSGGIKLMSGSIRVDATQLDHGLLQGLLDDDHPQYALLALTPELATPNVFTAPNTFNAGIASNGDITLVGNLEQSGVEGVEDRLQNVNDGVDEGTWRQHVEVGQDMWASVSDDDPGYTVGSDGEDWMYAQRVGELVDTIGFSANSFYFNGGEAVFSCPIQAPAFLGVGGGASTVAGPIGPAGPPGATGPAGAPGGGGGSLTLTDGTHTVAGTTQITVTGGTVGGATPNATLAISGTSPLTTKGDLYGYTTVNARIPVGTDTFVLTADSTQAAGVKWAAPSGSNPFNVTPDTHGSGVPAFLANDYFEEVALDTGGTRFTGAIPWTWSNQNTATAVTAQGSLVLTSELNAGRSMNIVLQPIPSASVIAGAWRYRSKNAWIIPTGNNNGGMTAQESSSGHLLRFTVFLNGTVAQLDAGLFTNPTTNAGVAYGPADTFPFWPLLGLTEPMYMEMELASGTIFMRVSPTGVDGSFLPYTSVAQTTPFTTTPDHIGLYVEGLSGTGKAIMVTDWFEQMA